MPGRSVLLNVSITAKGLGSQNEVDEMKDVRVVEEQVTPKVNEVKHERVDSATMDVAPTVNTPLAIAASGDHISFTPAVQSCATCHQTTKADGSRLSYCKACTSVFYCSKDCQRLDWQSHKRHCSFSSREVSRKSSALSLASSPDPNSATSSAVSSPTEEMEL